MKFSVPYTNFVGLDEDNKQYISEMTLNYTSAADAVTKYNGIRLVFNLEERVEPRELRDVYDALEGNVAFIIPIHSTKVFEEYVGLPIVPSEMYNTLHQIAGAAQAGIKEMYATGAIMMDLPSLKPVIDKYGIKLRVLADVAQSDSSFVIGTTEIGPQSFWIRPEAVHFYEDVVSTMELSKIEKLGFYGRAESPPNLDLLIEDFPPCVKSSNFRNVHDRARTYCNMACKLGANCSICNNNFIDSI